MSQIEDIIASHNELLRTLKGLRLDGSLAESLRDVIRNLPLPVDLIVPLRDERKVVNLDTLASDIGRNERNINALIERFAQTDLLDPDDDIIPVRLVHEDSAGGGEFDQWKEVQSDGSGGYEDKTDGHTHTSTGESVWESNAVEGIPVGASTGTVVWVHAEKGSGFQYYFEYTHVIEYGVPTSDVEASSFSVSLTVTDRQGKPTSGTVAVFPANDRKDQLLADRMWKAKVSGTMVGQPAFGDPESTVTADAIFTEVMVGQWLKFDTSGVSYRIETYTDSTHVDVTGDASGEANNDGIVVSGDILTFIRLPTLVSGVDGILIGEDRHMTPFPARLGQEDAGGGGEYDQWAEVKPDGAGGWANETDGRTHTNTGQSLWESNGVIKIPSGVSTGKIVWVQIEYGSATQYSFHYAGNSEGEAPDALDVPLLHDEWYDVQGDEAWFTVDNRDWSNRFVEVAAIWDGGTPSDTGSWSEDNGGIGGSNVQHAESLSGAWKDQEEWKWFRLYLKGGGVAQNITKLDTDVGGASTTVGTWRMATDGTLEMQVTEYNTRISMRITIRAFNKRDAADAISVT